MSAALRRADARDSSGLSVTRKVDDRLCEAGVGTSRTWSCPTWCMRTSCAPPSLTLA